RPRLAYRVAAVATIDRGSDRARLLTSPGGKGEPAPIVTPGQARAWHPWPHPGTARLSGRDMSRCRAPLTGSPVVRRLLHGRPRLACTFRARRAPGTVGRAS